MGYTPKVTTDLCEATKDLLLFMRVQRITCTHLEVTDKGVLIVSWIWQAGYPLVSAALQGSELVLRQQRFGFDETSDATLFVIPLHLSVDGVASKVLLDGDDVRIGNDVRIGGPGVDPKHAKIVVSMGGFTIVDLGSKHGTRVNAEKVRERPLANEDVIQIGAA